MSWEFLNAQIVFSIKNRPRKVFIWKFVGKSKLLQKLEGKTSLIFWLKNNFFEVFLLRTFLGIYLGAESEFHIQNDFSDTFDPNSHPPKFTTIWPKIWNCRKSWFWGGHISEPTQNFCKRIFKLKRTLKDLPIWLSKVLKWLSLEEDMGLTKWSFLDL